MSSCPPLWAVKVKRRRRGDKRHRHIMPCLLNCGGRKSLPLPYDFLEVYDTFALVLVCYKICPGHGRPRPPKCADFVLRVTFCSLLLISLSHLNIGRIYRFFCEVLVTRNQIFGQANDAKKVFITQLYFVVRNLWFQAEEESIMLHRCRAMLDCDVLRDVLEDGAVPDFLPLFISKTKLLSVCV